MAKKITNKTTDKRKHLASACNIPICKYDTNLYVSKWFPFSSSHSCGIPESTNNIISVVNDNGIPNIVLNKNCALSGILLLNVCAIDFFSYQIQYVLLLHHLQYLQNYVQLLLGLQYL